MKGKKVAQKVKDVKMSVDVDLKIEQYRQKLQKLENQRKMFLTNAQKIEKEILQTIGAYNLLVNLKNEDKK